MVHRLNFLQKKFKDAYNVYTSWLSMIFTHFESEISIIEKNIFHMRFLDNAVNILSESIFNVFIKKTF